MITAQEESQVIIDRHPTVTTAVYYYSLVSTPTTTTTRHLDKTRLIIATFIKTSTRRHDDDIRGCVAGGRSCNHRRIDRRLAIDSGKGERALVSLTRLVHRPRNRRDSASDTLNEWRSCYVSELKMVSNSFTFRESPIPFYLSPSCRTRSFSFTLSHTAQVNSL